MYVGCQFSPPQLSTSCVSIHQLPPPPRDFTGRRCELDRLRAEVSKNGEAIYSIQGMGGVGKTALALKLAEELLGTYPDGQLFVELKGTSPRPVTTAEAFAHVIHSFQPGAKLPHGEQALQGRYQSVLHGKRVMLLLDNIRDASQVAPLIPPRNCLLIVTSRQHVSLPGIATVDIGTLPPEEACELLLRIAPRIADQADEIASLCGYLPLALRLAAGALVEHQDLAPLAYTRRLAVERNRLQLVDASFSLSYDLLSADMQRLWRMLAVFPGGFSVSGAASVWASDVPSASQSLSTLTRSSLVEWRPLGRNETEATGSVGRYRLHDLVRIFAESRLNLGERAGAERTHASHYVIVLLAIEKDYRQGGPRLDAAFDEADREWENITAGQAWAAKHAGTDDEAARLCTEYVNAGVECIQVLQDPPDHVRWLEDAVAASARRHDRPAEGLQLQRLGSAYGRLGDTRRSIEVLEKALTIARETGREKLEAGVLCSLGAAYARLTDYDRAMEILEKALSLSRKAGAQDVEAGTILDLAAVYQHLGETDRAVQLLEGALPVFRDRQDRRHEGHALMNLGGIYYVSFGDIDRATSCLEQALEIARDYGDRRDEGVILGNMAVICTDAGDAPRGLRLHALALDAARAVGDRSGEAHNILNLSRALSKAADYDGALAHAEAALAILNEIGERATVTEAQRMIAEWRERKRSG